MFHTKNNNFSRHPRSFALKILVVIMPIVIFGHYDHSYAQTLTEHIRLGECADSMSGDQPVIICRGFDNTYRIHRQPTPNQYADVKRQVMEDSNPVRATSKSARAVNREDENIQRETQVFTMEKITNMASYSDPAIFYSALAVCFSIIMLFLVLYHRAVDRRKKERDRLMQEREQMANQIGWIGPPS